MDSQRKRIRKLLPGLLMEPGFLLRRRPSPGLIASSVLKLEYSNIENE